MLWDTFSDVTGLGIAAMMIALVRQHGDGPRPPRARQVPTRMEAHGRVRTDEYYWLRERDNPDVMAYLAAENAYAEAAMADTAELRQRLFDEIKGRIRPDDASVPYRFDEHFYYTRYEHGREYPLHCRKRRSLQAEEEILLDEAALARGEDYFHVGAVTVSHKHDIVAFAADTVGRRLFTLYFKDLATGEVLPDRIPGTSGNMAWANDNRTLFYSKRDPETLRSNRIYRHRLGTDAAEDVLVYEEQDPTFSVSVHRTKSRRYLFIASHHTMTTEYRFLDADRPDEAFEVFLPRERGHEYELHHYGDDFFMLTNDGATNFRLVRTPSHRPGRDNWVEVIAGRADVQLTDLEIFGGHLVVAERSDGLTRLRIIPTDDRPEHYVHFDEPVYDLRIGVNMQFDTNLLRFDYQSLTTPRSTYDYNMDSRERILLKRVDVLGDFDPSHYRTERQHAITDDGTRIPISVVYRVDPEDERGREGQSGSAGARVDESSVRRRPRPLLLYGYGAYGHSLTASFSPARLSLLDRGFVFAIAHVRGGEEMGRRWYDEGRLVSKKNTFTDFIACAEYLIESGYTEPGRLFAQGGSAGGLLIGAVINMRADLFTGVVANVPFVDVTTTMLDERIPLTTGEYDEWGNPNREADYLYINSYSPYDNVKAQAYPHMLVTTGLHDSQVQYWEPAKWVARLRAVKTDERMILLKTDMDAGHGGKSGRFRQYEEVAFEYAFLVRLAGLTK